MSQYFDNDDKVKTFQREIKFEILGQQLTFITDNGVFSKKHIDEGTKLLLQALVPLRLSNDILDLGCGYGVIGITIAYFNKDCHVVLADVNKRALELTKLNVNNHHLHARCTCLISNIYENIDSEFDNIIINPPIRAGKDVTYSMYLGAYEHLKKNGCLFIVIRKAQGAPSAFKYLESLFKSVCVIAKGKGYWIIKALKI